MTPAAVTVLIPVFEQASFLPRALGSLLDQDVEDWVAYVLDDGSTDATPQARAEWARDPRIETMHWPDNRGLGTTLNTGLDLAATGRAVAYLPADDVWYADHLASLLPLLADPTVTLAWSGVRHHGFQDALDAPEGFGLQLVQVCHRSTGLRWPTRCELESDDLERLFWHRLRRGRTAATGKVTSEWTDHPDQRHKAIRESFDGGLNVFRSRYRVAEPLRFHSSDSGTVDEVERYQRFRERSYPAPPDGLRVLLVGELAFNPERVLALAERGHRLFGLWTEDGLGDSTVGPLPFGHVEDLPRQDWAQAVRRLRPDVIYAQLNWRAVPFAHAVLESTGGVPFVWHFKEAPQRSVLRGEWGMLADLVTRSDACLVATDEERRWFELALPELAPGSLGVMDGDLPKSEWLDANPSPKLSELDGMPHTAVIGRPIGLDAGFVTALARRGVHIHLHGLVNGPGPSGEWRTWLSRARAKAPGHIHVHPAIGPNRWVPELSRYDAGWLHRFTSQNGGDIRRATWDDLNIPARLPVLLAAGLPLLLQRNAGHTVAVERIATESKTGLVYHDPDDLVERLEQEISGRRFGIHAWASRRDFTFDAHADRLIDVLTDAAGRPGAGQL